MKDTEQERRDLYPNQTVQQSQSVQEAKSSVPEYTVARPTQSYTNASGASVYYMPEPEKKKTGTGKIVLIIVSIFLALCLLLPMLFGVFVLVGIGTLGSGSDNFSMLTAPPGGSFSVIDVQGELSYGSSTYNHSGTLDYIDSLIETDNDKGILLFMNTPGGGVYESDELYRALQRYREETGRPVWVYMGPVCASGGYYASMAADYILANWNTTTGSIGVYISLQDYSGLYDLLGIQAVLIKAGENKGTGLMGLPISQSQQDMFQSQVDEDYDVFVGLVETGRNMSHEQALSLADGSSYSATQALEHGLLDELGSWDETLEIFEEQTGASPYYPNVSSPSYVDQMFGMLQSLVPQSDSAVLLNRFESLPQGVPLAYASDLANSFEVTELGG